LLQIDVTKIVMHGVTNRLQLPAEPRLNWDPKQPSELTARKSQTRQ